MPAKPLLDGDPLWYKDAILYELHVGTFSPDGTFDGAVERLDHLVALGADAVELLPVVEFPGRRGWGYDGVDLWAPHHAYGGPDGLRRLVDACHARGLGVVIDVVYNHLGPAGNHLADFGPYFADRHPTNWGPGLNVDGPGSDEVRAFVVDNARMWLRDFHADGLRLEDHGAEVQAGCGHGQHAAELAATDDADRADGHGASSTGYSATEAVWRSTHSSRRSESSSSKAASTRAARRAALTAPARPMASVPTGMPAGIWTME